MYDYAVSILHCVFEGGIIMKLIISIFGALLGLLAAAFVADKSVRFAQKNVKRYITIDKKIS